MRNAYRQAAEQFGVKWEGRNYDPDDWDKADPLNRALSAANACLHGIVQAAIITAGYSPAIGFIHTGKALSFVYDIADLYKVEMIVPLVFEVVAESEQQRGAAEPDGVPRTVSETRACWSGFLPDIEEVLYGRADSGTSADGAAGGPEPVDDRTEGRDIPRPYDSPPAG